MVAVAAVTDVFSLASIDNLLPPSIDVPLRLISTVTKPDEDAVDKDGNIKPQSVDYSKLTPILIKAVQELSAKNEALIKRIETLENK